MDHLKLETKSHHHPYDIGWIKKGSCIKVMDLYYVPISNGKFYQDFVACDVIDMDKCHILLERPNVMLMLLIKVKSIYVHLEG